MAPFIDRLKESPSSNVYVKIFSVVLGVSPSKESEAAAQALRTNGHIDAD